MEKDPLITLIIPVYNVSGYLTQCLDSVYGQTYKNIEILIIDDGSTDDSGRLCDEYALKDSRAAVFHTENHGLSAARNYGLDRAHGEYIAFLDSDDWLELNAIEVLVCYALAYDADIVACFYCKEWINQTKLPSVPDKIVVCDGEQALYDFICFGYKEDGVWNKLYRSGMFSALRFPVGRLCEDAAVTYRLLEAAQKYVSIPDILFHYRMRKSGICFSDTIQFQLDFWLARYEMYEALQMKGKRYRWGCMTRCISIFRTIWLQYSDYSEQLRQMEPDKREEIFNLMHDFIVSHIAEVFFGNYTMKEKLVYCLSLSHNSLYMSFLSSAYKICRKIKKHSGCSEETSILFP